MSISRYRTVIVADRRGKTFFQQSTFQSIGPLHPHTPTMIRFQILPWREVNGLAQLPQVAQVIELDFCGFQLPIPGVWKKILASEATPGLPAKRRDKSFPARTRVVGIIDPVARSKAAYLKRELTDRKFASPQAGCRWLGVSLSRRP